MGRRIDSLKERWRGMRGSQGFRNFVLFLAFVAVSTLFWLILKLNDSVTRTFDVALRIENVPDTVTFITDPPAEFHVTLRDKGTNILRSGIVRRPQMSLNFREYAGKGTFRVSQADLLSTLKARFGNSAQIASISLDSLNLTYSTAKGKRVPVVVVADVTSAPGSVISEVPSAIQRSAMIYSNTTVTDTITRVYTEKILRRNLSETTEIEVKLRPIPSVKIVPSSVMVRIPVEPLVKKESMVTVQAENVPEGENLLLFPSKVQVVYYVPMTLFSSDLVPVDVTVDYRDLKRTPGDRIPVRLKSAADYVASPELRTDSVEYTLIRN